MCMVFYHAMFTVGFMFDAPYAKKLFNFFGYVSPAFAFVFIMLCGLSSTLSRNNLKRSLPILAAALAVSAVSVAFVPESPIVFGILHLLGSSVLLYSFTEKLFRKIPCALGIVISVALFFLCYNVQNGYLGFEGFFKISLPAVLYKNNAFSFLGFLKADTSYSDYFPLLPWGLAFLTGVFAGTLLKGSYPKFMYKERVPFFTLLGTNAFFVYAIHQPVIYGVSYILTAISS